MHVRIYKPSKSPTQSGYGKSKEWLLEGIAHEDARSNDQLMGWISSDDTSSQIRLWFSNKAEAVSFAEKEGYSVETWEPTERSIKPKNYASNFS